MKTTLYQTAKTLLLFTFLINLTSGYAQAPEKMSYQAVVRDKDNKLLNNQPVGAKMSIIQGSDNGKTVYSEIFNPNPETNANGLLTLEIGGGDPVSGTFAGIEWSKGPYFIRTEIDPTGGSNYSITGTSQLLSVPFALHAKTADNVDDADNDPTNELQELSLSGTSLSLSRGGGSITLSSGLSLPYNGNISSNGNAFSVENQGSGGGIKATTPTGVGVYGNTTSSSGLGYGVMGSSGSSDGRGIYGEASSVSGNNYGVFGRSSSNVGTGVFGWVTPSTGINYGVSGLSASSSGRGVYGEASSTTGNNYGVFGKTNSSQGHGVYGIAESSTGNTYSVMGENKSSTGTGVYGIATSKSGINYGVRGITSSSSGRGVYGEASSVTGTTYGVAGTSRSSSGYGVFGRTSSATGVNYGVYGESESSQARAVYGLAKNSTGYTFGVFGRSASFGGGIGVKGINSAMPTGTVYVQDPKPIGVYGEVAYEYGYSGFFRGGMVYIEKELGIGGFSSKALHVQGGASKTEGGSSWMVWSDERLKTDIRKYTRGLSDIASLNPVLFHYSEDNPMNLPSDTEQVGFIAQEVQKIFPEAVSIGINDYLEFNIDPINIALVNAIKELKDENDSLKAENESIKTRLERLEKLMVTTAEKASK